MHTMPLQASVLDKRTRWTIGIFGIFVAALVICAAFFTMPPLHNSASSTHAAGDAYRQYLHSIVLPDGTRCVVWMNILDSFPTFAALSCDFAHTSFLAQ